MPSTKLGIFVPSRYQVEGDLAIYCCGMPVMISLLRGVNVGGHNKIKMEALRALYESLGLLDPQTNIQSGNVVFRTEERDVDLLAKRIEAGIERSCGVLPGVIVRTASYLRDVIAR